MVHTYDAIIVGAGGAGLMAALEASKAANVAVLTKLYPPARTQGQRRGASAQLSATWKKTTGNGTSSIR